MKPRHLILALALNLIVLRTDSWHIAARIFRLALTVILGILLYRLAMTPDLTGMLPGWTGGQGVPKEYPALFETAVYPIIAGMVRTILLVLIIPVLVNIVLQAVSLVRNR